MIASTGEVDTQPSLQAVLRLKADADAVSLAVLARGLDVCAGARMEAKLGFFYGSCLMNELRCAV